MEPLQLVLITLAFFTAVLLSFLGIQAFLFLKNLKKTLEKQSLLLEKLEPNLSTEVKLITDKVRKITKKQKIWRSSRLFKKAS